MSTDEYPITADEPRAFPSFTALRVAHSELLQRDPEEGNHDDYLRDVEEFIGKGQATGAILASEEERRASQSMLNYWVTVLYRARRKPPNATLKEYTPTFTLDIKDVPCPYPGVRPFEEHESKFFFGRQRQIDYILNRLKEDPLLIIVGASGSGKTSLVQAGILPALRREILENGKRHFFPKLAPGPQPLLSLSRMLAADAGAPTDPDSATLKALLGDPQKLSRLIAGMDLPVVLFIDDFDELFWLCKSKDERRAFVENLWSVIRSQDKRHIIILAMRGGDYDDKINQLPPEIVEYFERTRVLLPMLNANEVRDAIEKPAELVYLKLEEPPTPKSAAPSEIDAAKPFESNRKSTETIVQKLIKEIASEATGLPLLQFTLTKLYEYREGNLILYRTFEHLGGCRAALSEQAEEFFKNLPPDLQGTARRVLQRMIKLNAETKPFLSPVLRQDLYHAGGNTRRVDAVLNLLVKKQLVRMTMEDAVVMESSSILEQQIPITESKTSLADRFELTHSSLFSSWQRMAEWVQKKQNARFWRGLMIFSVTFLLAALLCFGYMFWVGHKQDYTLSVRLAEQSIKQLGNNRLDVAISLGKRAYELDKNPITRDKLLRLLNVLQFTPRPKTFLSKEDFEIEDMSFSPNGKQLAAIDSRGRVNIWDVDPNDQHLTHEQSLPTAGKANYPLLFGEVNNAPVLATTAASGVNDVIVWNVGTGESITFTGEGEFVDFAFRPNYTELAIVSAGLNDKSDSSTVTLWDAATGKKNDTFNIDGVVTCLGFSSDGKYLALGTEDGQVIMRNLVEHGPDRIFNGSGEAKGKRRLSGTRSKDADSDAAIADLAFSFSNEELKLAASTEGNIAIVWDITGKEKPKKFWGEKTSGSMVVYFSKGDRVLAGVNNGKIYLWDIRPVGNGESLAKQSYRPVYPV
ncbi:MAG: AAA family ATPase, partial [Pyrinomonadaceae bacterium]